MILTVEHVTTYRYDLPVRGVVQSHRLTPSSYEGQSVLAWDISVSDSLAGGGFRDGAGDWVQGCSVPGPVSQIEVRVSGTVETRDLAGVLRGYRETVPPMAYLRDTLVTRCDVALVELGRDAARAGRDPLDRAHRLATAVAAAIIYDPSTTDAHTTAAEALALGSGVCQDHTHALLAIARNEGIPARYVSGYLHADAEGVPHEAAHAWAELHVEGLGWVGFDAANNCCPDERYIRLGSGLDAREAAPIRGTARGGGQEHLDVTVAVQQAQQ
ncbi:transglutaminase family protein [Halodurantibacterium flavum]|uniref:Transglutaminase domain-containing protein n=1 Tax=Halodurantibacterium flavum TaxID=1382802 RepID=A0ABW4S6H3_9RHOB